MPATGRECPKCRYDFAGEFEAWRESCPLRGQCPECGFEFAWVDLLGKPQVRGERRAGRTVRVPGPVGCAMLVLMALLLVAVTAIAVHWFTSGAA